MKICLITPYFLPEYNACAVRIASFVKKWGEKDIEIQIITSNSDNKSEYRNTISQLPESIKIKRVYKLAGNTNHFLFRLMKELIWSFLIFFKILFLKTEILFVTSPLFFPAFMTILAGKIKKKRCFLDIRDLYPDVVIELLNIKKHGLLYKILRKIEKFNYNNCEKIFITTIGLKKTVKTRTNTPVFLARNGADIADFNNEKHVIEQNKNDRNFSIVFHGNIGKLYDMELIINLGSKLKSRGINDIKIYIYGEGIKKNYLESKISKMHLEDIVFYFPPVNHKSIPNLLHSFHAGIVPLIDGKLKQSIFPVKVYEYIACGLPIIISEGSEAGDFVKKHEIGVSIGNNEIDSIIKFLISLKNNTNKRIDMKKKMDNIKTEFDRENIADKVLIEIMKNEK